MVDDVQQHQNYHPPNMGNVQFNDQEVSVGMSVKEGGVDEE